MNKKYIFGLGTGRCGTVSLSALLSFQDDCYVSHENGTGLKLPWKVNTQLFERYTRSIDSNNQNFVGDIGFNILPYVPLLIERFPGVRFVVMQRDKADTIASYMRKTVGTNHWTNHDGSEWRHHAWDMGYPKYNATSKEECLSLYYDNYYDICRDTLPSLDTIWVNTLELNDRDVVMDMLRFCGFTDPKYRQIQKNQINKDST